MKFLPLVVFIATLLAGPFTVSAQVASLPIGSTNAVLQDALRQIDNFILSIELLSKDELYIEQFLYKKNNRGYSYERDGDPAPLMRKKLADAINAINWNKPEYEGRKFQTSYDGTKDLIAQDTWHLLFGTSNEFTLERNERGELVPPPSAYKIDLVAALMRGSVHAFFVNNIERALLEAEIEDDTGKVLVRQDSRDDRAKDHTEADYIEVTQKGEERILRLRLTSVNQRDGILWLSPTIATSGWSGRVTIWYKNGVQQVFSLADGRLLPSLSVRRAKGGVELMVSSVDGFTIEASENLQEWSAPYLSPVIEPTSPSFLHRFTDPAERGTRFYRLRVEGTVQQNRR